MLTDKITLLHIRNVYILIRINHEEQFVEFKVIKSGSSIFNKNSELECLVV